MLRLEHATLGRLVGYMGEKDGYRFGMPKLRNIVLSRDVLFQPKVVCNSCDIAQMESMCPTRHVAPTEEIEVLQNYKSDDINTAPTSGGINGSNTEIYQDCKSVREKKQPNWMTSGELVCQVNDGQEGYCLSPISYTEAMQSNERKQRLKSMNEELASL
jgi:hypothetical protein